MRVRCVLLASLVVAIFAADALALCGARARARRQQRRADRSAQVCGIFGCR